MVSLGRGGWNRESGWTRASLAGLWRWLSRDRLASQICHRIDNPGLAVLTNPSSSPYRVFPDLKFLTSSTLHAGCGASHQSPSAASSEACTCHIVMVQSQSLGLAHPHCGFTFHLSPLTCKKRDTTDSDLQSKATSHLVLFRTRWFPDLGSFKCSAADGV